VWSLGSARGPLLPVHRRPVPARFVPWPWHGRGLAPSSSHLRQPPAGRGACNSARHSHGVDCWIAPAHAPSSSEFWWERRSALRLAGDSRVTLSAARGPYLRFIWCTSLHSYCTAVFGQMCIKRRKALSFQTWQLSIHFRTISLDEAKKAPPHDCTIINKVVPYRMSRMSKPEQDHMHHHASIGLCECSANVGHNLASLDRNF